MSTFTSTIFGLVCLWVSRRKTGKFYVSKRVHIYEQKTVKLIEIHNKSLGHLTTNSSTNNQISESLDFQQILFAITLEYLEIL